MSRYKAYIFDFDLTLVDSTKPIVACFKHTLKTFGYDIPDDGVYLFLCPGFTQALEQIELLT
ncbi:MAG: HAD family hydrolase, partial [Lachnospiraceae bacterium]|nr:HAD family hydrolase [Lachnospiraceae bacterium]